MPLEGSRERITYIQPHDIISKGKHYLHSEVGQIMTTKLERISELSNQEVKVEYGYSNDRLTRENNELLNKTSTTVRQARWR